MANPTAETMNKANGATHEFKNKVLGAEESLEKMSHNVGERIGAMASDVAHASSDYVRTGRDYVKENPAKGLAIAAATGLVVGSLLTMVLRQRQP